MAAEEFSKIEIYDNSIMSKRASTSSTHAPPFNTTGTAFCPQPLAPRKAEVDYGGLVTVRSVLDYTILRMLYSPFQTSLATEDLTNVYESNTTFSARTGTVEGELN